MIFSLNDLVETAIFLKNIGNFNDKFWNDYAVPGLVFMLRMNHKDFDEETFKIKIKEKINELEELKIDHVYGEVLEEQKYESQSS